MNFNFFVICCSLFFSLNSFAQSAHTQVVKPAPVLEIQYSSEFSAVSFSKDEKYIAAGFEDGLVKVIEIATQKELFNVKVTDPVFHVEISPSGKYLVVASVNKKNRAVHVVAYTMATQQKLFQIPLTGYDEIALRFTSDENRITIASSFDTKIYDLSLKKSEYL